MSSEDNKFGFVDRSPPKGRYREIRSIAVLHWMINGLIMNRFVTHTTKTLALLAILLLPVQRSMAATCGCHSGVSQPSSGAMASGAMASCCSRDAVSCCCSSHDLGQSCCQASSSGSKSQSEQCPDRYCETATTEAIALSVDSSLEIDLSAITVHRISTIADESGPQNSLASTVAAGTTNGSELCVQLCRYRL
ncbi:MAG: hypothetical protein GXP26_00700 [Planctomycetes bacterium]|nr:hypothetical protein [Planctomycetota bacterium]